MPLLPIVTSDSLAVQVTVYEQNTRTLKNITGGTVTGYATRGGKRVSGTGSLPDAVNGVGKLTFAAGALDAGAWQVKVRLQLGTEIQTVFSDGILVTDD